MDINRQRNSLQHRNSRKRRQMEASPATGMTSLPKKNLAKARTNQRQKGEPENMSAMSEKTPGASSKKQEKQNDQTSQQIVTSSINKTTEPRRSSRKRRKTVSLLSAILSDANSPRAHAYYRDHPDVSLAEIEEPPLLEEEEDDDVVAFLAEQLKSTIDDVCEEEDESGGEEEDHPDDSWDWDCEENLDESDDDESF